MSEHCLKISLPNHIKRADAQAVSHRVQSVLQEYANAKFIIGTQHETADEFIITLMAYRFNAIDWMALADYCLEHAAVRFAAMCETKRLKMVHQARAALDFDDRKPDA